MVDRSKLLRDFDAGQFLDLLFVFAVTTVLCIRFFLAITGYPKIGGENLHIAHMLWGGLLMLVALVFLLSFLDRSHRHFAAIIGGVGFGTFIDEVGKFVTHDHDYFYHPSVAIIYIVFTLLYMAMRSLHRERSTRSQEYLANALSEVMHIATGDLDQRERERALQYLAHCDPKLPLTKYLKLALVEAVPDAENRPRLLARWGAIVMDQYRRLAVSREFGIGLIVFFCIQLVIKLARISRITGLLPDAGTLLNQLSIFERTSAITDTNGFVLWLQTTTSLLSSGFIILGLVFVFRDRLRALRMFQRSILVALLITQVFIFYHIKWLGLSELVFNLIMFFTLRYAIGHEKLWRSPPRGTQR